MMTRENVLRKIASLNKLAAAGSGATHAERDTARAMASKLERIYPPEKTGDGVQWSYQNGAAEIRFTWSTDTTTY
ncbi:MAG: hypothetical protein KGZ65_04190 [Sphingomonadales bacterium]|nr:hypothetical protein [Sphingomonadaceae bacterium]MBS3930413.1 hypothetical protein [Sphingomonadales bacterium]